MRSIPSAGREIAGLADMVEAIRLLSGHAKTVFPFRARQRFDQQAEHDVFDEQVN
jgi:hypothetical protein